VPLFLVPTLLEMAIHLWLLDREYSTTFNIVVYVHSVVDSITTTTGNSSFYLLAS